MNSSRNLWQTRHGHDLSGKSNDEARSCGYLYVAHRQSEVLQYLVKGQQVFVRGLPVFGIFDSSVYHCKMVKVDIFVNEIQLVGSAPKPDGQTESTEAGQQSEAAAASEAPAPAEPQPQAPEKKSNGRGKK